MPKDSVYIKAFARARPLSSDEKKKGAKEIAKCSDGKVVLSSGGKDQSFAFDDSFDVSKKNSEIYAKLGDHLLNSLFDGVNSALVAFGTTGSGKTTLLCGSEQDTGLGQMCLENVFKRVKETSGSKNYLVTASYIEINENETVDLLNPHGKDMNVVNHPRFGIYVDRLSEFVVQNGDELVNLFEQGSRARKSGAGGGRLHRQKSSAVFILTLHQKSQKQEMGVRSSLYLVDLSGVESAMAKDSSLSKNMSALLNVINGLGDSKKKGTTVNYRESKLTRLLQDVFGGNCVTTAVVCLSPADVAFQDTCTGLQVAQNLRSIKNKTKINTDEGEFIVKEIRDELARIREKVLAKSPSKEEVAKYETLVADMQYAKKLSWEAKVKATAAFEQERRLNMANRGLVDHVLNEADNKKASRGLEEKVSGLQKERDQAAAECKEKRGRVDAMKDELKKKIDEYMKASDGGRISDSEAKNRTAAIYDLKEKLRVESENMRKARVRVNELEDRIAKEKAAAQNEGLQIINNMELRRATEKEARKRAEKEHEAMIKEEVDRVQIDVEQEKAELRMNAARGKEFSKDEVVKMASQLAELTADKKVVALRIKLLEDEKTTAEQSLEELFQRHKGEMEKLQAANFQTFREYRETFERQKLEIEHRFRGLLEDAVKDAIFLSGRNNELMMENSELRKDVAKLKDKVTALEGGKK